MEPDIITVINEIIDFIEPVDDVIPYCILCSNLGHYYAIDQVVICPQCYISDSF